MPIDHHRRFVSVLSKRSERQVKVFSLNYDPLVERAAELERVRVSDGFQGHEKPFFDAGSFQHDIAVVQRSWRGPRRRRIPTWIRLAKLHGSLGWYDCPVTGVRCGGFHAPIPEGTKRLMIPPQYRKAAETGFPPYSTLWTEYRGALIHGSKPVNRLVTIGYGMADEHVNNVIEAALERSDFTLIIVAKKLSDDAFTRWSEKLNVLIATEDRCSLYGDIGAGHPTLSSFEGIVEELNQ